MFSVQQRSSRFFLRVANWLHYNRGKKAWTYVADVYAVTGGLTALIALSFAFSSVRHGDRYLAEAAARADAPGDATVAAAD